MPAAAEAARIGTAIIDPFLDVSKHFNKITPITHAFGRVLVLNERRIDPQMLKALHNHLEASPLDWDNDKHVHAIALVKRSRVPVFSAGLSHPNDELLDHAAQLAHRIATLNTPLVCVMDGPTSGIAASVSLVAPLRISTDASLVSFREGPNLLGPVMPGTAFAMRHLLLDDSGSPACPLARYLAVTGDSLHGIENVLAGVATHHLPSANISAYVKKFCESKSSDLRVLDMLTEEFAASSPSVDDWNRWNTERMEQIYRCFNHLSLAEIVDALKKENTSWSQQVLQKMEKHSPTIMELNLETVNAATLASQKKPALPSELPDLLTSFKTDLKILHSVTETSDFHTAMKLDDKSIMQFDAASVLPAETVLDPRMTSRDSWLASELGDGIDDRSDATGTQEQNNDDAPVAWVSSLAQHVELTKTSKQRQTWLNKIVSGSVGDGVGVSSESASAVDNAGSVEGDSDEVIRETDVEDGSDIAWATRTFRVFAHRCVTGLPAVRDVRLVVTGEVSGSGELAVTGEEALVFFQQNWNSFLDEERNLCAISAAPAEQWRVGEDNDAETEEREAEKQEDAKASDRAENESDDGSLKTAHGEFFPRKYYDISSIVDPNIGGVEGGRERYNTMRKEKWGLRQRVDSVVARKCVGIGEGGMFLKWK
ncbi:hypothetical protein HDU83_006722 [Entophlyctis luteolus]|nr:hypothetical protein HDU83_006722 [Entophlyctis luteolus]